MKRGEYETGQVDLANRRLDVGPKRIAQNRLSKFCGPNRGPTSVLGGQNRGLNGAESTLS